MPDLTLRDTIEFHVDKGLSRRMLLAEIVEEQGSPVHQADNCDELCQYVHYWHEVEAELDKMLADGVLTMGTWEQEQDHVVVTRWSPNTAAKMRGSAP